jgi:type III secretory pathway component EscV
MAYVLQAWLPLLVWKQVEAPQYRKGFITVTFLSAALIATALAIRLLHAREVAKRRNAQTTNHDEQTSSDEEATGLGSDAGLSQIKAP